MSRAGPGSVEPDVAEGAEPAAGPPHKTLSRPSHRLVLLPQAGRRPFQGHQDQQVEFFLCKRYKSS